MKRRLERKKGSQLYYFLNAVLTIGANHNMTGNYSGLSGNCTELSGNCTGLSGDCSGLSGDFSELIGDCSRLSGDCSGLRGDLDDCEITEEDRQAGVRIDNLISNKTKGDLL